MAFTLRMFNYSVIGKVEADEITFFNKHNHASPASSAVLTLAIPRKIE